MSNQTSGPQDEQRLKRRVSLRREVLQYLYDYGPKNRERLYGGFDETPTAEIEPVLDELRQLGYVEIGPNDIVLLTASGKECLKDGK